VESRVRSLFEPMPLGLALPLAPALAPLRRETEGWHTSSRVGVARGAHAGQEDGDMSGSTGRRPPAGARPEKILVPLDGSRLGESVLATLTRFARVRPRSILLLHVFTPALHRGRAAAYHSFSEERMTMERYLTRVGDRLRRGGGEVRALLRSGDPAEEIVDCARRERVDLIAMSTHGRTGLRRVLLGSVAEAVVRRARRPVLLVRGAGSGRSRP
jgi:nucleotide-binding universal stress UspA family protein